MADFAFEIARALLEMSEFVAGSSGVQPTFTFNGQQIACLSSKKVKRNLFGAGGFTPDNDLRLTVSTADMSQIPSPGQMITFESDQWRIEAVEYGPDRSTIVLLCNDPNRAAGIIEREM